MRENNTVLANMTKAELCDVLFFTHRKMKSEAIIMLEKHIQSEIWEKEV